jgi:Family of unknown function (DUF5706)
MRTEESWRSLQQVNEWIRLADAKAGAVLAASGVLGAFLVNSVPRLADFHVHSTRAALLTIAIACTGASALITLQTLAPRLRVSEARSLIYFDHIALRYANDSDAFVDTYIELVADENSLLRQVTEQVWANSVIARSKFRRVGYAVRLLGLAMLTSGAAVVVARLWNW